jgi:hypothetical protein
MGLTSLKARLQAIPQSCTGLSDSNRVPPARCDGMCLFLNSLQPQVPCNVAINADREALLRV